MEIGRAIDKWKVSVVLYEFCFSSCANYIAPSAFIIFVQKGTIIGLHGSMPRSVGYYLNTSDADEESIGEKISAYPEVYRKITIPESIFFLDIKASEQYVTRYFEIDRNRRLYDNGECGEIPPITLIVGPDYFSEFYFGNVLEFNWDVEAIKNNPMYAGLSAKFSIVLDNALFPVSTPTIDMLKPSECFSLE